MTCLRYLMLAVLLAPTAAFAQGGPIAEIGTGLGLTIESSTGSDLTSAGAPGGGILGQPTIYATFFTASGMTVEPQLAISVLSVSGNNLTTLGFAFQMGYLFKGAEETSPFVAGNFALQSVSSDNASDNDVAVGAQVGLRMPEGKTMGVRLELGARRWFDNEINEWSIGVGFGGVLRSSR